MSFALEIKVETPLQSYRDKIVNDMMEAGISPTIVSCLNRVPYTIIGFTTAKSVVDYINSYMDYELRKTDALCVYPLIKYYVKAVCDSPAGDELCEIIHVYHGEGDRWGTKDALRRWLDNN